MWRRAPSRLRAWQENAPFCAHDSPTMVLCARRGCGVDLGPSGMPAGACRYHPGTPVFHEGLKSWSCCKDTNKPVLDFEQFLQLPGCASAEAHTREAQPVPPSAAPKPAAQAADTGGLSKSMEGMQLATPPPVPVPVPVPVPTLTAGPRPPEPEERDSEPCASVQAGTTCQRRGCGFVQKDTVDKRDPTNEVCRYHKGTPIFHEGSKGWTCCKRRVLHFDDFLQFEPCTLAKHGHLFTKAKPAASDRVDCRIDHYETPSDVRVTVYAKGVDADKSVIDIRENEVRMSAMFLLTHRWCSPWC